MLFNRDSTIQKCFRRFCTVCKSEKSIPYQPFRRRVIPSGRSSIHSSSRSDNVPYYPDARHTKASSVRTTWIFFRTLLWIEKLLFQLASVWTTQQPVQTTLSDRASDFLSKSKFGKIAATVRTTWIPVRTRYSLRQVRNSNSTLQTLVCHGPDARSTDMEIACKRSTIRMAIPMVRTREALVRKLLAANVWPSGGQSLTVQTRLSNRKDFQWKSWNFGRTVVRPDAPCPPSGRSPYLSKQLPIWTLSL